MKRNVKVGLITSGGDCQGLNAAIRGVGKALYNNLDNVEVYGIYDGYRGLIEGDYKYMQPGDFSGILTDGGTILGTSRQKYVPGKAIVDGNGNDLMPQMMSTYNRLNLDCLVIMGGNGTQKSAKLLMDAGMNVITLPKTIDNDIWGTDTTFGYQSAVDIATHFMDYIHTTAFSHSRVFIIELMGRDAGWLTLSAGVASGADIILIPEIPYDINKVAQSIEKRKKRGSNYTIIAIAEGAVSVNDAVLSEDERRAIKDSRKQQSVAYKLADELKDVLGEMPHVAIPGHYQRGGPPCPLDRVLATRFGTAAAHLILERKFGYMVGMKDNEIVAIPLEEAASKTKFLPVDHPLIQSARDVGTSFGD